MKLTLTLTKLAAAAMIAITAVGSAYGDAFFYAVNQFTTVHKLNGDTGAVVDSFAVPFIPLGQRAASIAVVGNTGYYTILGDANVYKVDMTTHAYLGIAFNTGNSASMNGITVDSDQHLWFAHGGGGAGNNLQEFDTAGNLLSTHAFPTVSSSYRDGSVVYGGFVVANRGDQQGPYDKYTIPAGNAPLAYVPPAPGTPFIQDPVQNFGNNGIAFNGVNFYISNEQQHFVRKYTINGVFVSQAPLASSSRYENWTFASQDIRSDINVTPRNATNEVGTAHTVCAEVTSTSGSNIVAVVGATVTFNVTNGPNAGVNGTSVTDSNGVACFTYVGAGGVGTDTINVSFVDASGSVHSATATKVWVRPSNLPPVAKCKNVTVSADANCQGVASVDDGSFDPDAGDTITITQTPPGPYPLGTTVVTLTVTDSHGASASCTATVTVADTTPPTVNCPTNIVVCNDRGQCSAVVNYTASASDNCGLASLDVSLPSGTIFPKGTTTVTVTAVDTSSNSASCTFTVTVNDCEAPQAACRPAQNPAGKKIPVAGKNPKSGQNPDGFYQLLAKDNCDPTASLKIYIKDSIDGPCGGAFAAGPYAPGVIVKLTQSPGHAEANPMAGVVVAHIHTKGEPVMVVTDSSGNTTCHKCFVPPPPK